MTDDRSERRLVDSWHSVALDDIGLAGYSLAVASEPEGGTSLWLVAVDQLGVPDTDHGDERPPHELAGPLPGAFQQRVDRRADTTEQEKS